MRTTTLAVWACLLGGAGLSYGASASQLASARRGLERSRVEGPCFVPLFAGAGALRGPASARGVCMVEGSGESGEKQYGAASDYLKKIPGNLRGLAIRNVNQDTYTRAARKKEYMGQGPSIDNINKELEDDEEDPFDQAMDVLELEDIELGKFDGDLDDAAILKDLKSKMHPEDFRNLFGRGVGDLL